MEFVEAIKSVCLKYATFSGRARRREYWFFFLFNILVSCALLLISPVLYKLWVLVAIIPSFAVCVRRLHDVGKPGWLLLVYFAILGILFVMSVVVIGKEYSNLWKMISEGYNVATKYLVWLYLPYIASAPLGIYLIVLFCKGSQPGANQYGPNPKGVSAAAFCRKCGARIKTDAVFCVKCGEKFDRAAGENSAIETVTYCKKCGEQKPDGAKFCIKCGESFDETSEN